MKHHECAGYARIMAPGRPCCRVDRNARTLREPVDQSMIRRYRIAALRKKAIAAYCRRSQQDPCEAPRRFLRFAGTKVQFLQAGIPEYVWPEGPEYVRLSVCGWDALLRYSHERLGPPFELLVDWETLDHGIGRHPRPTLTAKIRLQDSTHAARMAWRMIQLLIALYQVRARTPHG